MTSANRGWSRTCPFCACEVPAEATVCRGCGAEVVFGASWRELRDGQKTGGWCAAGIYLLSVMQFRNVSFDLFHLIVAVGLGVAAGHGVVTSRKRDEVRFFRRGGYF